MAEAMPKPPDGETTILRDNEITRQRVEGDSDNKLRKLLRYIALRALPNPLVNRFPPPPLSELFLRPPTIFDHDALN
ncbi:hypothetical protein C0995_010665 [Termitomyces sp. Mi166|nr:hypothetical protein C0995_010665 [Termitomyces sp. Mi166\